MTRLARASDFPAAIPALSASALAKRAGHAARPDYPSQHDHSAPAHHDAAGAGTSSGKFSDRRAVLSYRQHFAAVWQRFVVANFDSPAHAAHVFQVDASTADNWFRGTNAPSGWIVARAVADPATRDAALAMLTAQS